MDKKAVYVVGDSISMHYGPYLKKYLQNCFVYDRKREEGQPETNLDKPMGANGGDSSMVLDFLQQQESKIMQNDYLVINCGLHDIKTDQVTLTKQVSLEEYSRNLKKIITLVQGKHTQMLWIRTTPVDDEDHQKCGKPFHRYNRDVEEYNRAADEIMKQNGIFTIDLYTFTNSLGEKPHYDGLHFSENIRALQAAFIAGHLLQLFALPGKKEQERKTAVLSDDLTGAMEAGVQLVKKGLTAGVILDTDSMDKLDFFCDAVVLNTDSRNISPEAAYKKVRRCVDDIKTAGGIPEYKKVDSTLRGNIGSELEAVLESTGCNMIIFVPALPYNGRTTKNGYHYLNGRLLTESDLSADPFSPVSSACISERLTNQTTLQIGQIYLDSLRSGVNDIVKKLNELHTSGNRIVIVDAENEKDLEDIAQAIGESPLKLMPCGSAGLLAHLRGTGEMQQDEKERQVRVNRKDPVLIMSGSPARASKLQIHRAGTQGMNVTLFDLFQNESIEKVKQKAIEILRNGQDLIIDGAGTGKSEISEAYRGNKELMLADSCRIQARLGALVESILNEVSLSGMMILGGETAVNVCKNLGAYAIEIKGEVEPLVPLGLLVGGTCGRMPVVTKAGGFGSEDIILKAIEFIKGVKRDE
jgi:D-threonate/D-erythronate kinase